MCGICGHIGKRNISYEEIERCNNLMWHRGPDSSGIIKLEGEGFHVALAHRRLSIIDLSISGCQPMRSFDNKITVIFNGEIYNYRELKCELQYPFRTNSDTEVVIAAYRKWGIDCLLHFNGMFALSIYDSETERLFLARDRLGKKPLYCYEDDGNIFFASTLKAVMACPYFKSSMDVDAIRMLLTRAYVISPYTVFEKVKKVEPGELWEIREGSHIQKKRYWDLYHHYDDIKKCFIGGYAEAKTAVKEKLMKAVRLRLHADVPIGVLLSGGIDSTLVAAVAVEMSEQPVQTYTIGFHDKRYDEAVFAKQIADFLRTDHHELYIDEEDLISVIDVLQDAYDEPFADSSQIAMMYVAKMASDNGIKVLLTGDGGDELFCGYPIYKDEKIAQNIDWMGGFLYYFGLGKGDADIPFPVKVIVANRDRRYKTQFNMLGYRKVVDSILPGNSVLYDESEIHEKDWAVKKMLLDMRSYLPDDNLCKVDRASMYFSVEARSPILDDEVVALALSLKQKYRYQNGVSKRILRDVLYDIVPKEMMERPKMGFSVPIGEWLRGRMREELLSYSRRGFLQKQGIFSPNETEAIIDQWLGIKTKAPRGRNYKEIMWAFYMFQKWYLKYMPD